jgi:hypothetical protein
MYIIFFERLSQQQFGRGHLDHTTIGVVGPRLRAMVQPPPPLRNATGAQTLSHGPKAPPLFDTMFQFCMSPFAH